MISLCRYFLAELEMPDSEEQGEIINNFMKDLFSGLKKDAEKRGEQFPKFKVPPKQDTIETLRKKPIEV